MRRHPEEFNKIKVCLVAPCHIQPSEDWIKALPDIDTIIVDDSDGKIKVDKRVYDYKKQKEVLKNKYKGFKEFHKSSACKNFGNYLAYKEGYEVIIGIDSDCLCSTGFIEQHLRALNMIGDGWENPLQMTNKYSRGFPYSERKLEVVANMGLWRGVLDINGADRGEEPTDPLVERNNIALGMIPFSGMNWAVKRDYLPYLFFLPNFGDFRRHDDIFGGYIFQKFLKAHNKCLSYGLPIVEHVSEVNPEEDAKEEDAMYKYDKEFYRIINRCDFSSLKSFKPKLKGKFKPLLKSLNWWKSLYEN